MPIEVINTGVYPNDSTGDPIRDAYAKINRNFTLFAPVAFTGQYSSLYGTPSFAKVAYSGLYTDLLGTPVLGLLAFLNTINNTNWYGMPLAINHGGTGQVTAPAAFDALSPMTNWGDMIFGKQYGAGNRLPIGGNGQILSVANGIPSWINPTIPVVNEIINISNNQVTNITNELPAVTLPAQGAYVHYGVASGTNVLSTTVYPAITAYTDGIFIELLCSNYNTGNVTLNNAGMGPHPVRWPDGSELAANTLIPGGIVYLTAVGGVFQLIAGGVVSVEAPPPPAPDLTSGRLLRIIVFTSTGYYTPSTEASSAAVFATGGGGSGGGSGWSTGGGVGLRAAGGTGGESGTTVLSYVGVSHAAPILCTIGARGAPVNSGEYTQSGSGSGTHFGSYAYAPGGGGGYNSTGAENRSPSGSSSGGVCNILNLGSNPGDGPFGQYDTTGPALGVINVVGGCGGASFWGGAAGGQNITGPSVNGLDATGYGSGGGGAAFSGYPGVNITYGGYGGNGVIVIFEFS